MTLSPHRKEQTVATETDADHSDEPDGKYMRQLGKVGKTVDQRIRRLQKGYLGGKSSAQATVAQLRRSVAMSPGQNPEIWGWTEFPAPPGTGDMPTREEWAVHLAMTLYAMHQQGRLQPAYKRGMTFGEVVSKLGVETGRDDTLWLRFTAVLTASSIAGVREHLQSLVGQLHANSYFVPVDYATLADDLAFLLNPRTANRIRLKWERDYYRVPNTTATPSENPSTITPEN